MSAAALPCPPTSRAPFRPAPWTRGGHLQTVLGNLLRRRLVWQPPVERLEVKGADGVRLLCLASWQPGPRPARPALVLVHGLGGHAGAGYLVSAGTLAYARGWHVVRVNLRGAGESLDLCPRLYHAGLTDDLRDVLRALSGTTRNLSLAGFSLSGGLALLLASRDRAALVPDLRAVASICAPLDLAACSQRLSAPRNWIYRGHYMRALRESYRARQQRLPGLYPAGRERGLRTVREYDEAIVAPLCGFRDADDYYARSSAGPWLEHLAVPALVLAAVDDPLVPPEGVTRWPHGPRTWVELTGTGGHLGYVGPCSAPGRFWAAERLLEFLEPWGSA